MQAAGIERRTDRGPRVPIDVLVELSHEGFDEPFEADGVDVGAGGLSMRATYLPDVGQRLKCRFASPGDGAPVEAACEVVWSKDSGPHVGRFGMRFVDIDESSEDAVRELVGTLGEAATDPELEAPEQPHPVKLFLDGVATPIEARIVERDEVGMQVEQDLPFFEVGKGLDAQNGMRKRGRLESVDLRMHDGTPRLVLGVKWEQRQELEQAPAPDALPDADDTIADHVADVAEPPAQAPARAQAQGSAPAARPATPRPPTPRAPDADAPSAAPPAHATVEPAPQAPEAPPAPHKPPQVVRPDERAAAEAGPPTLRTAARNMLASLQRARGEHLGPAAQKLGATLRVARDRARPWLARAWAWIAQAAAWLAAHAGPATRRFAGRASAFGRRFGVALRARVGTKVPALAPKSRGSKQAARGRRATAPPPTRTNVAGQQPARRAAQPAKKSHRRTVIVSVLAFAGAGLTVYALGSGGPEETAAAATEPVEAEAEQASEGDGDSTQASSQETTPAQERGELPEPAGQAAGGAEPAPRPQAPGTVPPSSPYGATAAEQGASRSERAAATQNAAGAAAGAQQLSQTFGAAQVPDGRSFMLRMSQPVKGIRGVAVESGFQVSIPGSLSLDRAGPIAAAHAGVERSMILNRGDHAELTIKFVEGRKPPYKVSARGRAIEVVLGK